MILTVVPLYGIRLDAISTRPLREASFCLLEIEYRRSEALLLLIVANLHITSSVKNVDEEFLNGWCLLNPVTLLIHPASTCYIEFILMSLIYYKLLSYI